MKSLSVLLFVESRYKVNRKRVKEKIRKVLDEQAMKTPVEVSVAIVGDRKMRQLHKKYKGEDRTTNILSFSLTEGQTATTPSDVVRLGDIVMSYPQIIQESAQEEMLVDDRIDQLVAHGMDHLLGIHH